MDGWNQTGLDWSGWRKRNTPILGLTAPPPPNCSLGRTKDHLRTERCRYIVWQGSRIRLALFPERMTLFFFAYVWGPYGEWMCVDGWGDGCEIRSVSTM